MTSIDTVFPKTEKKLNGETDYQKALEFVAARKNMSKYRSVMDFLFCESFLEQRWDCFRFYNEQGSQLKDIPGMTAEVLDMYDTLLSEGVLELCLIALNERREISWTAMRREFQAVCKQAA